MRWHAQAPASLGNKPVLLAGPVMCTMLEIKEVGRRNFHPCRLRAVSPAKGAVTDGAMEHVRLAAVKHRLLAVDDRRAFHDPVVLGDRLLERCHQRHVVVMNCAAVVLMLMAGLGLLHRRGRRRMLVVGVILRVLGGTGDATRQQQNSRDEKKEAYKATVAAFFHVKSAM